MLSGHSAKEANPIAARFAVPSNSNGTGIYKPPPSFPLVTVDICKGPRLFCLFFSGSGGHRQRVRMEFTKLIYLVRFVNIDP